jgi:hypothetical protein
LGWDPYNSAAREGNLSHSEVCCNIFFISYSAGGGQDYSAQWAEYYRSIGKIEEAENIEAQIRAKAAAAQPAGYPAPAGAPYAAPAGQPGYPAPAGYYPPQQVLHRVKLQGQLC